MLQYRNFKFNGKEDFVGYIEERIVDYWKSYSDSFSRVCEICEDLDSVSYSESEAFEKLIDDYVNVFSQDYGCAYYNLFGDVYNILNNYTEDEIQELMDNDYYEHLFEDDENFFLSMLEKLNLSDLSDDDLDE